MDNSSRNTVIFIATITFSAMLLMAAHFYSGWRDADAAPAVEAAKAENPALAVEEASIEETPPAKDEEEFPEEEDFPPMGEPTVDLDENGTSASAAAPLPAPQPADADIAAQSYEANN